MVKILLNAGANIDSETLFFARIMVEYSRGLLYVGRLKIETTETIEKMIEEAMRKQQQ